ncbi:hypothetical protein D3C78_1610570 [compost metagenome]
MTNAERDSGTLATWALSAGVSQDDLRAARYPVSMHHWAWLAVLVIQRAKVQAARLWASGCFLAIRMGPPPMVEPSCLPLGMGATPTEKDADLRILVIEPVE